MTCGAAFRTASASGAAAPITCSQLSSTIRACLSRSHAAKPDTGLASDGGIPSTVLSALGTSSGSANEASPTNQTPSAYDALHGLGDRDRHRGFADPARTDDGQETAPGQIASPERR